MKVAINACFGGFNLSAEAVLRLVEMGSELVAVGDLPAWEGFPLSDPRELRDGYRTLGGLMDSILVKDDKTYSVNDDRESRAHPDLIRVIEEMGDAANGMCAKLRIVEVPDGVAWEISEYDGNEHIAEQHRTWS